MKSMRSCKHATELMSQKLDRKLSFAENCWLNTHLILCVNCRRCKKQLTLLDKAGEQKRENLDSSQ